MSPIANMLVQIKNAQMVGHERTVVPFSKLKYAIAMLLKDKGYLATVEKKKKKQHKTELPYLELGLAYTDGKGAIHDVVLHSKPSRRMYAGKDALYPVKNGFGISIVSTSQGIMTGDAARKAGVGGELVCEVW